MEHTDGMAVETLEQAAGWLDRVGLALVFPKDDLVLPSLWAAAGGAETYAERDADGRFVRWAPPLPFVWSAKDELAVRGLACAGKHLRGRASLVAPRLVAPLAAIVAAAEPSELERDVVEVLRTAGPLSTRELPELLPRYERRQVRAALDRLQRRLVVTHAGLEQTDGWPAIVVDLVERRYADVLSARPSPDEARRVLASCLLASASELSAADLGAVFGWRKPESTAVLESLGRPTRDDGGVTVWIAG